MVTVVTRQDDWIMDGHSAIKELRTLFPAVKAGKRPENSVTEVHGQWQFWYVSVVMDKSSSSVVEFSTWNYTVLFKSVTGTMVNNYGNNCGRFQVTET